MSVAIDKFRRSMRNLIDRRRRADPEWRSVSLEGWIEIDAVAADEFMLLGSDRAALLHSFCWPSEQTGTPVWIATLHGVISCGSVLPEVVENAFVSVFDKPNQLHMAAIDTRRDSLDAVVLYSTKHHCTRHLQGAEWQWPIDWIEQFYTWSIDRGAGLRRTKVKISSRMQHLKNHSGNNINTGMEGFDTIRKYGRQRAADEREKLLRCKSATKVKVDFNSDDIFIYRDYRAWCAIHCAYNWVPVPRRLENAVDFMFEDASERAAFEDRWFPGRHPTFR